MKYKWLYAVAIIVAISSFFTQGILQGILQSVAYVYSSWYCPSHYQGTLNVRGIDDTITITRDKTGVPHIFASTIHDAYFGQGFVIAQDRLWQIEQIRRFSGGRLSEIIGERTLLLDQASRIYGFYRKAVEDAIKVNKSSSWYKSQTSYIMGINAYLNSTWYCPPLEFSLLGMEKPQMWTDVDSFALTRVLWWQMAKGWNIELVTAELIQAVGEHTKELFTNHNYFPTHLPHGIEINFQPETENPKKIKKESEFQIPEAGGSNCWAVSGKFTESGKPILACDPHLASTNPGFWYEVHLNVEKEKWQMGGASVPGVFGVSYGYNGNIAFGVTLACTDSEDLFIEKFEKGSHKYEYKGEILDAKIYTEKIIVKTKEEPFHYVHTEHVIETVHGPIVSQLYRLDAQIASSSTALQIPMDLTSYHDSQLSSSCPTCFEKLANYTLPGVNFVCADNQGNIGYMTLGIIPKRKKGDGLIPQPGWTGEYDWIDWVHVYDLPRALNPKKGFIVSANNPIITSDEYPHYLGNVWTAGWRALRATQYIQEKIDTGKKITIEHIKSLQMDTLSLPALNLISHLDQFNLLSEPNVEIKQGLDLLKSWDYKIEPTAVSPTVYHMFRQKIFKNLLNPILGDDLASKYLGKGARAGFKSTNEFYSLEMVALNRMLDDPNSWWISKAGGATKLLQKSLTEAVLELKQKFGNDTSTWTWGRLHKITFSHPMGSQKPLNLLLNIGPYPVKGDMDTVHLTAFIPDGSGWESNFNPTYRLVVNFANSTAFDSLCFPGQSGNVGSKHFGNTIDMFLQGQYNVFLLSTLETLEIYNNNKIVLLK